MLFILYVKKMQYLLIKFYLSLLDTTLIGSYSLLHRYIFSNMCSYVYINIMTVPECKGYFDIIHDIYFLTTDWNNTKVDHKVKNNKRPLATGPPTPKLYGKIKF